MVLRRKVKKKVKIFMVVVFFATLIILFSFDNKEVKKIPMAPKIDYVAEVLASSDNLFDEGFLSWVGINYGNEVLKKLNLKFENNSYNVQVWHELTGNSYFVLQDLYHNRYENNRDVSYVSSTKDSISVGFAGDVCLADNWFIMPEYESRGKGILGVLSKNMADYMNNLDWMIVNSEFAFSNRGSAMAGKLYTFRAKTSNVSVYGEMGVDMVTLANNHVYDFGRDAFYDTLNTLKEASLPYIGAGENAAEAQKAHYLIINGYKISFLSATRAEKYILTPEASENSPGVFRCYDPTRLAERIKEEKEKSDFVVAIVHWGKENYHDLENVQRETGKLYIDSGADMVIGHHAHVLQGVEFYKGKLIAYNLGNFLFNSLVVDTGIIEWKLSNSGESEFYFYPAIQKNYSTSELTGDEANRLYQNMTDWSINASFLEDGKIVEK